MNYQSTIKAAQACIDAYKAGNTPGDALIEVNKLYRTLIRHTLAHPFKTTDLYLWAIGPFFQQIIELINQQDWKPLPADFFDDIED